MPLLRRAGAFHVAAVLLYLVAAAVSTWPLAAQLSTHGAGEKFLNAAYIGRFLIDSPLSTWLAPSFWQLNYPDAGSAVLVALPQFFVAKGLALFMGHVPAMNLSLLLHHALGGYAGFRLALRVWGPRRPTRLQEVAGPLAAGFAFGFSAHALAVFANGQPENVGFVYLAVAAEAAWVLVRERRWVGLPWLVVSFVGAFMSSPYLVMAGLLASWPFGLWALARERSSRSGVGALALGVTCALLFAHYSGAQEGEEGRLLCPAEISKEVPEARAFPLGQAPLRQLLRYPPIDHDVIVVDPAHLMLPVHPGQESLGYYGGYLGWALVLFAAAGWGRLPRRGRVLCCAAALGPLLLSLGPYLMLNGWVFTWQGRPLLMPLEWLQRAPGLGRVFATVQFPERLIVGAVLPLAMLVPLGARRLMSWHPGVALAALVAVAPWVEQLTVGPVAPPLATFPFDPPDAYVALAQYDDGDALVDLPPLGWDAQRRVMVDAHGAPVPPPLNLTRALVRGAWVHGRPVPYGGCVQGDLIFNASAQKSALAEGLGDALMMKPTPGTLRSAAAQLREAGYGWLVFHPGTGLLSPRQEELALRVLGDAMERVYDGQDGTVLFRLPEVQEAPPPRAAGEP